MIKWWWDEMRDETRYSIIRRYAAKFYHMARTLKNDRLPFTTYHLQLTTSFLPSLLTAAPQKQDFNLWKRHAWVISHAPHIITLLLRYFLLLEIKTCRRSLFVDEFTQVTHVGPRARAIHRSCSLGTIYRCLDDENNHSGFGYGKMTRAHHLFFKPEQTRYPGERRKRDVLESVSKIGIPKWSGLHWIHVENYDTLRRR